MASQEQARSVSATKAEREADLVMGTNSSSIVSKRSVEIQYYPRPHFFRYFVKKPQRRAPLINRGYWLRMHAVAETIKRFLEGSREHRKYVLNLGCGYDPVPFQFLSGEPSLCSNASFVDIDYEKLMINKRTMITQTSELRDVLGDVQSYPDNSAVLMRAEHYVGIGCDLKNLKKLDEALKSEIKSADSPILCIAEVSLTYMEVVSANAVISWASSLGPNVQFCLLEQFFPDGPDHPFASTMMKHFHKLRAPLHSIHTYPSLNAQERRFINAGWRNAHAQSLWDVWNDDNFLSKSKRVALDKVEAFDEWEEFAHFASHYFLLLASTKEAHSSTTVTNEVLLPSTLFSSTGSWRLMYQNTASGKAERRYGCIVQDSSSSLGVYGGLGPKSRLVTTDIYSTSDCVNGQAQAVPPQSIPARMCHTLTNLDNGDCLLVGGRTSPANAMSDAWFREDDKWRRGPDLPVPRFRHSALQLSLGGSGDGVLVYGGKSEQESILGDWLLWEKYTGWHLLETTDKTLTPRFGASFERIDKNTGMLFGGLGPSGIISQDFWVWSIRSRHDGQKYVHLTDITEMLKAVTPVYDLVCRFGATTTVISQGVLLIGGVSLRGTVSAAHEIMLIDTQKLKESIGSGQPYSPEIFTWIGLGSDSKIPRPLLAGHVSYPVKLSEVLIVGGGGVCFSFGTFWNNGTWLLQPTSSGHENKWLLHQEMQPAKQNTTQETTEYRSVALPSNPTAKLNELQNIERKEVRAAEEFAEVIKRGRPIIIPGADLGPCIQLWTKEYLMKIVGPERQVVVHEADVQAMNFQTKNFAYVSKSFQSFLEEVYTGSKQYLRSISADQPAKRPANITEDFPGLKDDFKLPPYLKQVEENVHSSALRISGPVTMWLHYDVMANVLCQIQGQKRLILYPPSDVEHLQIPAGSSSSTMNIFQDKHDGSIVSVPNTTPHEVIMNPGDILFIPPLWLHTTSPIGGISIAVNVFFRNLTKGYAAGRDVYANRDLQSYEKGRLDVSKIARSFEELPVDIARFYLLRLANELREKALSL